MNISILYYDDATKLDQVQRIADQLQSVLGDDTKVIAMPKNYDVLLNCSIDQLVAVRSVIETALALKIDSESYSVVSSSTYLS